MKKNLIIFLFFILTGRLCTAQQNDSIKCEIRNLGNQVNSSFIDYAPLVSADGSLLIFTSRRPHSENKTKNLKDRIFYSNFDPQKTIWSMAMAFSDTINIPERNNSAVSISNNGQQMLIYRDDINTNGDLFESHLSGADWSEPVNLGAPINSDDKEPSACLSQDGETIYFVSDRKGGLGGLDIWYSIKNSDGNWGEAINIGAPINSEKDEDGLFLHSDGKTLFFSSQGHNSMGGYDVYMSVLDPTTKAGSAPKNLGPSINTSGDDIYFVLEANGKTGYYSSNRLGGLGEKDIYRIDFFEDILNTNLRLLKGRILDKKGNAIKSKITVIDKASGKTIGTFSSNGSTGKYLITIPADKNYELKVEAKGYEDYLYSSTDNNVADYKEVDKNIVLKSKAGTKSNKVNPSIFGRVLDENGNPLKVLIEIIDNNTNKVVGKYHNSINTGAFNIDIKGGDYRIVFSKPCYLFKSVYANTSNTSGFKKDLKDINMEQARVGKKIVLNNILFDYNKSTLREESYFTLDLAIKLMNNLESLEVEISGHTDNRGSESHNQVLSQDRARDVMKYLVRMGIDEERLKYKGYGFSQPIAPNETEMGRQLNRRTELKVLKVDLEAEQIKEINQLKDFIEAEAKGNPDVTTLSESNDSIGNISLPDRFKQFDSEKNGKISFTEIIPAIDSFLSKNSQISAEEIIALIDYYFEQPLPNLQK